jgi:uncharacterized protein (TIGR00297 family)
LTDLPMQLYLGIVLGLLISLAAWRVGALSTSGALAAALTGSLIFGLGGLPWSVLLLLFFISSTALSRLFKRRKKGLSEKYSKGSRRDWAQVFANGGLGAALVVVHALLPNEVWPWLAFSGAMAAVNADTWATELGVLSRRSPRLITSGRVVEMGTSGGISTVGSTAALAGSGLIAIASAVFSYLLGIPASMLSWVFLVVLLAGFTGSAADSFLGATIQAIFWCPSCLKETERSPRHTCGSQTTLRRGLIGLNNDLVNLACALTGAAVAAALYHLLTLVI